MTKIEILKAIRVQVVEIKNCLVTLDSTVASLTNSYKVEAEGEIDSLEGMMDYVKTKADQIKAALDQWPN